MLLLTLHFLQVLTRGRGWSLQSLGRQGGWDSVLYGQGLKLLWVCWVQVGGAVDDVTIQIK